MKIEDKIKSITEKFPVFLEKTISTLLWIDFILCNERTDKSRVSEHTIKWLLYPEERDTKEINFLGVWFQKELSWGPDELLDFATKELKKRKGYTLEEWKHNYTEDISTDIVLGDKSFSRKDEIERLNALGRTSQIWKNFIQMNNGRHQISFTIISNYKEKEVIKSCPMAIPYWDPDAKVWILSPLTYDEDLFEDNIKALVEKLNLAIHYDLILHWYGNKNSIEASFNVGINETFEDFKIQPYPYQKAAIAHGKKIKRILIADEMGLGKTVESIGIVHTEKAYPCIVVAPKSVLYNWVSEFNKFTGVKATVHGDKSPSKDVIICSYEQAKNYLKIKDHFVSIIVDESHNIRNENTQRYKIVRELSQNKDFRIFLTGTPMINSPRDFVAQLFCLGWLRLESKKRFLSRYVKGNKGINLEELNIKLRSVCMIRRLKKDVEADMPPITQQNLLTEIENLSDYNTVLEEFKSYVDEIRELEDTERMKKQAEVLSKIQELKKLAAHLMLPTAIAQLKEIIENTKQKVVVFAHHRSIIASAAKELGTTLIIDGDTPAIRRKEIVDTFVQDERATSIILSIRAGSEGIDGLQNVSSLVAFLELDWTAAKHDQAEARLHRNGQKGNVLALYFIAVNTIYEKIYSIIERKRKESETVTGGQADIIKQSSVFSEFMKETFNIVFTSNKENNDTELPELVGEQ